MSRPRARYRPAAGLALLAAALAGGCGLAGRDPVVVEVADRVPPQRGRVATARISPEEPVGVERLGSGWEVVRGLEGPRLRLAETWSRLTFYAMERGVTAVEIEAAVQTPRKGEGRGVRPERRRWVARLNGETVKGPALRRGEARYRIELPDGWVRRGENTLALGVRGGRPSRLERVRRALLVRRVRFVRPGQDEAEGAAAVPARTQIVVREEGRGFLRRRVVEMPAWSELELPVWLPRRARLRGAVALGATAPETAPVPVVARIGLEDEAGVWHELFEREIGGRGSERLDLDLSPWQETLAVLTLRVRGPAGGVAELVAPVIRGRAGLAIEQAAPPAAGLARPPASGRAGRPDVLFILLDAARADAFGCYGAERPTPVIDGLAAAGTRFAAARAPSSWTGQSVPSIFSGLYPEATGIEHWASRLPDGVTTVAERFAAAGYRTVLWAQHPVYKRRDDLTRGFGRVLMGSAEERDRLPAAGELFEGEGPHFVFVHLLPPHTPYEPPAPFRGRFTAAAVERMPLDGETLSDFPTRRDPAELSANERRYVRDRYDENVAFADDLVGRMLALAGSTGRLEGALVIVTSDHGEAFLEHGHFLHERHLYHEFIDVPLVVRWPAGSSGFRPVVEQPVSLVDLLPTLVDAVDLGGAAGGEESAGMQGRSLLPDVFGPGAPARPIYAYTRGAARGTHRAQPELMLESEGYRVLIQHAATRSTLLFDLARDPREARDLAADDPERTARLRRGALLQHLVNATILEGLGRAAEGGDLDAETSAALRALGYLD